MAAGKAQKRTMQSYFCCGSSAEIICLETVFMKLLKDFNIYSKRKTRTFK